MMSHDTVLKCVWPEVDDKTVRPMYVSVTARYDRRLCSVVAQESFVLPSSPRHRGKPSNSTACVTTAENINHAVARAIEVSRTACKDDFPPHFRSHS